MKLRVIVAIVLVIALGGCSSMRGDGHEPVVIAGGGSAGVYYSYSQGLAQAMNDELGLNAQAAETAGSVDNLQRVASGEAFVGFTQGDTAADAIRGTGAFDSPLPIRAVARVYDEYVHVVVPAESDINGISDLEGRRVSLGAAGSGVHVIASRVLEAEGVGIDEIENPALGLEESIEALSAGEIDGFFWVGGIPTPGIQGLAEDTDIRLLSIAPGIVDAANSAHSGVYRLADVPIGLYGIEEPVVTMAVPNYLITSEQADAGTIYDLLDVLFVHRSELAADTPAVAYLDRRQAIFTAPMELHPGAAEYYVSSRR